jgi:hypothetical protein
MTNKSTSGLASAALFFKEIFANQRTVGAAAPSAPALGKHMASKVPALADGQYVVELGAGTGAITAQLLNSGIQGDQLVCVNDFPISRWYRGTRPGSSVCWRMIMASAANPFPASYRAFRFGHYPKQSLSPSCPKRRRSFPPVDDLFNSPTISVKGPILPCRHSVVGILRWSG